MSYGILLLRVVIGGTVFAHGAQKLFGWFGGHGLRGTAGFFGSTGWRQPLLMAFLAGLGEASGLAFAFGFLTPLAALGIVTVMLNAIFAVHWKNGFFNGDGGLEFPLTLATVAGAIAATGPGRFSIDNPDRLGRQHQRPLVGRRRRRRGDRDHGGELHRLPRAPANAGSARRLKRPDEATGEPSFRPALKPPPKTP